MSFASTHPPVTALAIPRSHAGLRLSSLYGEHGALGNTPPEAESLDNLKVITIQDQQYSLVDTLGETYLVPYYPTSDTGEESALHAEEFTVDRARRFFYTAEPNLDIRATRAAIDALKTEYLAATDPDIQATKGRFLVGMMINRMERLARVYFQTDRQGTNIDLTEKQTEGLARAHEHLEALRTLHKNGEGDIEAEEERLLNEIRSNLKPIRDEFTLYYKFLIDSGQSKGTSPILQHVRLAHEKPDPDGVLPHLVREMGKMMAFGAPSMQVQARQNVIQHIGQAMGAIDQVKDSLLSLLENLTASNSVRNATNACKLEPSLERATRRGILDQGAIATIKEFAALSRAQASIKSEDSSNFQPLRERADLLAATMGKVHNKLRISGREIKGPVIAELRDLLSEGFSLMARMGQSRIPLNQYAPAFSDQRIHHTPGQDDTHDQSSVRNFERHVHAWCARQQGTAQEVRR